MINAFYINSVFDIEPWPTLANKAAIKVGMTKILLGLLAVVP